MIEITNTIRESVEELIGSGVKIIPGLLSAAIVILLTRYAAQFALGMGQSLGERTLRSRSLQVLLAKSCYVATWTLGILFAAPLAFPGLNLGHIVSALGLGSVAIGFAFQDIFKNFLAGVLLLLQEPFRLGDQIIVGSYEGTVEHIDIRTTQICTYQGEKVLLPNSTVFTEAVQVRTAFASRRTDLAVGFDYNTPLSDAADLLMRTIAEVQGVLQEPVPEIDLVSFGASSIDFVVRYWTLPQQKQVRQVQSRAIIAIKAACDRADINIPYPIRTLYFYDQQRFNDYLPEASQAENQA